MKIPFLDFTHIHSSIEEKLIESFKRFLGSNQYILGENLKSFENEFSVYSGTKFCSGVSNGLDAIFLSLKSLGIGIGDEVIVPSNTYIATVLAVTYTGATPVLVEPDIDTYNICPIRILDHISPKTKAIIPVHLYGLPCDMPSIMTIAKEHKLFVVEDNAQSQGASINNKLTGSWGDLNATSFYPGKNLGALGDGGAITTNSELYYSTVNTYRNYGSNKKYFNDLIGYNMRLDELQASLLRIKLKELDSWNSNRISIAQLYNEYLANVGDLILPKVKANYRHVYHLYVIRSKFRNELQKYLAEKGVTTLIHYPIPVHNQKAYSNSDFAKMEFPIAEEISNTCLSLPIFPGLEFQNVIFICDCIKEFFSKY